MNNYTAYWKHYTDFKGRATRSEFWVPILINFAIALGLILASVCAVVTVMMSSLIGSIVLGSLVGVIIVWRLVRLVPDAAVIVRRTHDVGITGWVGVVLYICNFIPYVDIIADILLIIIGCMAADSADWSALAWQSDSQEAASAEKTTHSDAQLNAADIASDSDTKRYEQLSLDLDFDDLDQKSKDDDKSDK